MKQKKIKKEMQKIYGNYLTKKGQVAGITLIALVITIIVLIILARSEY